MRGRKPKERDKYVLRMSDGTFIEVTRDVYLEWYQSRRREKYQEERRRKYGVCSMEALTEKGMFHSSWMDDEDNPETIILKKLTIERMWEAIRELPKQEALLLEMLYFKEMPVKSVAEFYGCTDKTIQNRKKKILKKLKERIWQERDENDKQTGRT